MVNEFHQPNEEALKKCLQGHSNDANGVTVRLAWLAGLTRGEIHELTWEQVDYEQQLLHLPDRDVPLCEDLAQSLKKWSNFAVAALPYVMVSRQQKKHIMLQALTRLVKDVMEEIGQPEVGMLDLRYDFLRRELLTHDWPYVLRITGLSVTTYRNKLSGFFKANSDAAPTASRETEEYLLWKILQSNKDTPEGIALWLSWQMDLISREIVELTWDQVDFAANELHLPTRTLPMTNAVSGILQNEYAKRTPEDDPHVILAPKSRKPVDIARISAMVRTLLVRGGIETKSISVLRANANMRRDKQELMNFVRQQGCATIKSVMERFGYSESAAYNRLHALVEDGALTHVSSGYYPSDRIVPPEQHEQAVLDYIGKEKVAYCADIANLLHIGKRPTAKLLTGLVRAGKLKLERGSKQYRVSEAEMPECCILVTQ